MGGDGGCIAVNRRFLPQGGGDDVPAAIAKAAQLKGREIAAIRTKVCSLSNEALREPVVADELGNLFNKDAVLTALLEKRVPAAFAHVRGLRDLVECRLTRNAAAETTETAERDLQPGQVRPSAYVCPLTLLEFSGQHPFVVLRTTGWVLCEKALREVGVTGLQDEYGPFSEDDVVRLNPTEEERRELWQRMLERRERLDHDKREKKNAARHDKEESRKRARANGAKGGSGGGAGKGGGGIDEEGALGGSDAGGVAAGKKRKSRRDERDAAAAAGAAAAGAPHAASGRQGAVVATAQEAVRTQMAGSAVYNGLFHGGTKGGGTDASGKGGTGKGATSLFIATAGQRYSLG